MPVDVDGSIFTHETLIYDEIIHNPVSINFVTCVGIKFVQCGR